MKLSELFENDHDEDDDFPDEDLPSGEVDFGKAIVQIQRDCKPFLKQCGMEALAFRGFTNNYLAPFFKRATRQNRKPMNTSKVAQAEQDKWFDEHFGFKARSASVFTTGNYDDANSYGQVFAIFPIGDFQFVWSPKVGDLFMAQGSDNQTDFLNDGNYQDTNLPAALASDNEIMIDCKEYYAVKITSNKEAAKLLQALREN